MKIGNYIVTVRSADEPPMVELTDAIIDQMKAIILDRDQEIRPLIARLARSEAKNFYQENRERELEAQEVHRAEIDRYWKEQYEMHFDAIPYVDPAEREDPVLVFENPTE